MSGLEVFAVVSAVAAVISAYKDGGRIVAEIKERRARRKAPPPTRYLEESLSRGPLALEEAKNNGVERFGEAFAIGDSIAIDSLKDILIALQGSMLRHLYPACENDTLTDFSQLVDVSDIGRLRAVNALYELHMRMVASAPIARNLWPGGQVQSSNIQAQPGLGYPHSDNTLASQFSEGLPIHMPPQRKLDTTSRHPDETQQTFSSSSRSGSSHRFMSRFRRKSSQSSQLQSSPSSPPTKGTVSPTLQESSFRSTTPSALTDVNISSHTMTNDLWQGGSVLRIEKAATRTSSSSHVTSGTLPLPENDYGGFCKGAYYLQVGLKGDGVKLRNSSVAKTGEGWYWGCRDQRCVFEGPACKIGKEFFFDDTVREFKSNGMLLIRYRWSFLAKSHVAIKKTKEKIYDYRCIFCVLQGMPAPTITRKRLFLEHIAEHQTQNLDESILRKTLCINDRMAGDDEYFDVNFPPPVGGREGLSPGVVGVEPDERESANFEVEQPTSGVGLYEDAMLDGWRDP
ncbi:MAG: hypothetical protein Q9195_001398 [Heterodermia aff. obscurata]